MICLDPGRRRLRPILLKVVAGGVGGVRAPGGVLVLVNPTSIDFDKGKDMAIPAARFIRVSGDTQDERSQIADCDRAAEREGLEFVLPDFQLHAVSGSKGEKRHLEALDRALAAIEAGQIRAIVVAHSSRLTRLDPDDAMMYAIRVRRANGRVYSWDEPNFGAPDKMSRLLSMLAMDDNHEYSKTLSGHVNRKFRNEVDANNGFRGGAPTGYVIAGEKYRKQLIPSDGVCRCPNARNAPKYHKRVPDHRSDGDGMPSRTVPREPPLSSSGKGSAWRARR